MTPVTMTGVRGLVVRSRQRVVHMADNMAELLSVAVNVLLFSMLLLTLSIFLYSLFYYSYMPIDTHESHLNFQFSPCPRYLI